ncbi:unnamed protein product [Brugia timori]|uniref:TerD domain-containing protein n=1 Tax=Brugia timori TaxID=42155 RepID=A0A0R3QYK7_9BILA|nr:unnamed protein product [Brugia timori]
MANEKRCYQVKQLSVNVYCIREDDYCNHKPLMYLIIGYEKKTGNNWQFSSLGPNGLTVNVEAFAIIELGDSDHDKLGVLHTPGHTPDSLSLKTVIYCDLFHQYNEVILTYLHIFKSINIF